MNLAGWPGRRDGPRHVGFVAANALALLGLSYQVYVCFPPVRDEAWMSLWPMNGLALVGFAALYPIPRRLPRGLPRLGAFYLGFVAVLAGYGAFLDAFVGLYRGLGFPVRLMMSEILALMYGHILGLPMFLLLAAMNKVLGPLFFPGAATVENCPR